MTPYQKATVEADNLVNLIHTGNYLDLLMIRSIPFSYGRYVDSFKDKRVLDIGGHVGSFAVYAALRGASQVHTIEPLPRNLEFLKKYTSPYPQIKIFNGAVVRYLDIPRVLTSPASISNSHFGRNILRTTADVHHNSRIAEFTVPLISFDELMELKPHIIKMDCEGSEHELLSGFTANSELTHLLMEVHFLNDDHRIAWPLTLKNLQDQGFKIITGRDSVVYGTGQFGLLIMQR